MFWLILTILFYIPNLSYAIEPIVKITNFSSDSLPEWVEISNQSDSIIDLTNWSLKDLNNTALSLTGCLAPGLYQTFYKDSNWLNNTGDTISLYNHLGTLIDTLTYTEGRYDANPRSNNTCVPTVFPTNTPTSTPIPTNTSAPLPTLTPLPTNTPSPTTIPTATKTPTPTPKPTITPIPTIVLNIIPTEPALTPIIEPTPDISSIPTSDPILGINDIVKPTPPSAMSKLPSLISNILPILFIVSGGLLLLTPLILSKIKK